MKNENAPHSNDRASLVMARRVVMAAKVEENRSEPQAEYSEDRAFVSRSNGLVNIDNIEQSKIQKIITAQKSQPQVLVEGRFLAERFPSGISVMGGDIHELADTTVLATAGSALHIIIVLSGKLRFGYDDHDFYLRGKQDRTEALADISKVDLSNKTPTGTVVHRPSKEPTAVIVDIKRRCSFRRYLSKGRVRKLNIIIPHEWFERLASGESKAESMFWQHFAHHLSFVKWQPSPQVFHYCHEMMEAIDLKDQWQRNLYVETRATAIVGEMIRDVIQLPVKREVEPVEDPCHASSEHYDALCGAIEYIESYLHTDLKLEDIAKQSAMSVSALQRKFKQTFTCTVFEYVRNRRLDKVKEAMCKEKITIGEAAYMAGYNHPSNFITAFKRKFGVTPGELLTS